MQFGLLFGAVLLQVLLLALHGCESALPPQDPSSRDAKQNEKTPITLDDILASRYSASLGFAGSWSPTDGQLLNLQSINLALSFHRGEVILIILKIRCQNKGYFRKWRYHRI